VDNVEEVFCCIKIKTWIKIVQNMLDINIVVNKFSCNFWFDDIRKTFWWVSPYFL